MFFRNIIKPVQKIHLGKRAHTDAARLKNQTVLAAPSWLLGRVFPVTGGPVFIILEGMVLSMGLGQREVLKPGSACASLLM